MACWNWRFTLARRKKNSHHKLDGSNMITREMVTSCRKDSACVTKRRGMKKVWKGRKEMITRQVTSAPKAHRSAASRAQGRNWSIPTAVRAVTAIKSGGKRVKTANPTG